MLFSRSRPFTVSGTPSLTASGLTFPPPPEPPAGTERGRALTCAPRPSGPGPAGPARNSGPTGASGVVSWQPPNSRSRRAAPGAAMLNTARPRPPAPPPLPPGALHGLYAWLDALPLSRRKRHLARDFSDGGEGPGPGGPARGSRPRAERSSSSASGSPGA